MEDDYVPKPVPPPVAARPVGPAGGKPAGIQPTFSDQFSDPERDAYQEYQEDERRQQKLERTHRASLTRGQKAWETRRANAAHKLPDRRFATPTNPLGPYDAALTALHDQKAKIETAINLLEDLKGRST